MELGHDRRFEAELARECLQVGSLLRRVDFDRQQRGARGDDCELDASSDRAIFDLTPAAKQQIQLTRLRAARKART